MTNELDMHIDVAVIGAGLAGLTAAASAAETGATVALLDSRAPGGRARSAVKHGYVLNEGAHALYRERGGRAVLDSLGVRITGTSPNTSAYRVVWDGAVHKLPVTAPAILASRLLSLRSKRQVGSWFGDIAGLAERAGDRAFGDWLDGEGVRPDLRKWVLALARLSTYSATPEQLPARYVFGQLSPGGVWYVDGGWQAIVDELVRVAGAAGVTTLAATATQLTSDGGEWHVATPTGTVTASAVVLAVGPQAAVRLLGDDPADWVGRAGPAPRAACLDIGGDRGRLDFLLSADEPLYLSLHSDAARLAPPGRALYSVMRYLAPDDDVPADANRAALDTHAARAGVPPVGAREVDRFLAAPLVAGGSPQPGVPRPTGLELADRGILAAGDWLGDRLLADASITTGATAGHAAALHATATLRAATGGAGRGLTPRRGR